MIANYRHIGNIKGGIFLVGVFLIIGIFYYTNFLSKELREDNRQVVKLYAEIIAGAVNNDTDENINFIFDKLFEIQSYKLGKLLAERSVSSGT